MARLLRACGVPRWPDCRPALRQVGAGRRGLSAGGARALSTATASTATASRTRLLTSKTAPKRLMNIVGPAARLDVKFITPAWEEVEPGRITRIRDGGFLFDFNPQTSANAGDTSWVRFSISAFECGELLVMDRTVGLQLTHISHTAGARETKTVAWAPAKGGCMMELTLTHSHEGLGIDQSFRLPVTQAQFALLRQLLERSLPTITGFAWAAANPISASWSVANLGFHKETAALNVTYLGPWAPPDDAPAKQPRVIATKGRLFFKFAARQNSSSQKAENSRTFDWGKSVAFALRAEDCAEFAEMGPDTACDFRRAPLTLSRRESGKKMAWSRAPDGSGVVVAISTPDGLSLQLLLSWAELKVLQVLARSLIPHMLGMDYL